MASGDGLVVRLRPPLGRLTQAQAKRIAELSVAHGNGTLDLSSRAALQIRGVSEASYPALLDGLSALNLLDKSAEAEANRNVITQPFWQEGDRTQVIARALEAALAAAPLPGLPAKFGFAVDTGPQPVLRETPTDIRIEATSTGTLQLCADGAEICAEVEPAEAVQAAIDLAEWFLQARADLPGPAPGRMARLLRRGVVLPPAFAGMQRNPAPAPARQTPGPSTSGTLVALAFGQMQAETLVELASLSAVRMTPWRMILLEGATQAPDLRELITTQDDPLLRTMACTGAPRCPQGHAPTRTLARSLAPLVPAGQTLHVSGCAKACAHPRAADLTVLATPQGFDLIRNGTCADLPALTNLSPDTLPKALTP
ncbi:precorrin-3B synthase [Alphaproteobacteria bacterium KMM 3653]|uniref:Precorrin-3B synthase n=2 Tax=Harenicola maris TaxID=2841044 RepID=A0AAP2CP23_9RHOB|nr:precorrin-3B synthase [Harenicola maris]